MAALLATRPKRGGRLLPPPERASRSAGRARPRTWSGDRARLAQATGNLIANAIEHGGGAIELRGRAAGGSVRIDVIDDGAGLPAPVADLARRARGGRGARGRGLAIASSIARDHGGRLAGAPSQRGARLVLELPVVGGSGTGEDQDAWAADCMIFPAIAHDFYDASRHRVAPRPPNASH